MKMNSSIFLKTGRSIEVVLFVLEPQFVNGEATSFNPPKTWRSVTPCMDKSGLQFP